LHFNGLHSWGQVTANISDAFIKINGLIMFWEMLTGAPRALVKDTKKRNYIVIIALKTV